MNQKMERRSQSAQIVEQKLSTMKPLVSTGLLLVATTLVFSVKPAGMHPAITPAEV